MQIKSCFWIFFLLALGCTTVSAQVGLQLSYVAPAGDAAYFFKPAGAVELFFKSGDMDSHFKFGMSIGYYKFLPTQDTFPTYTIESGGANALLPGYDVIKKYSVVPIAAGIEYKLLDTKLSPFIGIDGYFYIIGYSHESYTRNLIDSYSDDTEWELGVAPKLGISYQLSDNWLISGGISPGLGITGTVNSQTYFKSFVSITHYADN